MCFDRHEIDDIDGFRLTRDQERALELELLARFVAAGGTSTITSLFAGFKPTWALLAADRLEDRGLVTLLDDRRTQVTAAGREEHETYGQDYYRVPRPEELLRGASSHGIY